MTLWNRRTVFVVLLISCSWNLHAQSTFSLKFHGGAPALANSLFETSNGYIICGSMYDTLEISHADMFIFGLNLNGDELFLKHIGSPDHQYFPREKISGQFNDGTSIIAYLASIDETLVCELVWFDENGDTTNTHQIASPVYEPGVEFTDFIEVLQLTVDSTHDYFYLSLGIYRPETQNDYVLQKRTKEGELVWEVYTDGPLDEGSICMSIDETGVLISELGAINSEYYRIIKKITGEGNIAWTFEVPEIPGSYFPRDILISEGKLHCSASGKPEGEIYNVPMLYAIDTVGALHWVTLIDDTAYNFQVLNNLTTTCDDGFVGAAQYHIPQIEGDTLDANENYSAWLIRYDHLGNILWDRKYSIVNSGIYHHEIYDLISTSDGGILFCGEARDNWLENPNLDWPPQQAWVVKLDACGCLVPGCDEFCTPPNCDVEIPIDLPAPDHFIFGPNPITQSLNIYFDGSDLILENLSFELYDITGRLVDRFKPSTSDTTYLWDLEHLSAGEYILSLLDRDQIIQSEKIIVR